MINTVSFDNNLPVEALLPIALDKFVEHSGISTATAWRWRKAGMLKTVNICGRVYVPIAEIIRFNARAAAGEFSQPARSPRR